MSARSLRTRIVLLVLASIGGVLLPLVILTYAFTMEEIEELFDARLAENAKTIDAIGANSSEIAGNEAKIVASAKPRSEPQPVVIRGHKYESQIGFQIWDADNHLQAASANFKGLVLDAAPAGYSDARFEGKHWRLFTYLADDGRSVRVGERYDSRREIGRALAAEACIPLLIAFPLLAFLVSVGVRRGLRPLHDLADQLAVRPVDATSPVGSADLPEELYPVVRALNGLLQRLGKTLEDERAFTTNAAHELRTPLAGAVIHLENAVNAPDLSRAKASLSDARAGLDRLTHLVNQLLDLARWDAGQAQSMYPVELRHCIEEELADAGAALADKNIEVVWQAPAVPVQVLGWDAGLRTLVRNLLENAIRYSPPEGKVQLVLNSEKGYVVFTIADQGPGIPEQARDQVLQRFRRAPDTVSTTGAGIGLSLVARIAQLHRAAIRLMDAEKGCGLRVEIRFPAPQKLSI
jgi:two-component system, OmpR family, sensor histidine kinase QseC